jgi:hypothetical protein
MGQDLNDNSAIEEFTRRLFSKVNTDEKNIIQMLAPDKLKFRDASDAFNLIAPTIPVLVCPDHHRDTFEQALKQVDWDSLNRFCVGFYPQQITKFRQLLQPVSTENLDLGYIWAGKYAFGPVMSKALAT